MIEQNKALVRRWYDEVWNQGRSEIIAELFTDDTVAHGLSDEDGKPVRGVEGFTTFQAKFRTAFPDLKITVEELIAEGDLVVARCHVSGVHAGDSLGVAASQRPIDITGVSITRIVNGKIAEGWNHFDFLTLYQQIGVL